MENKTNIGDSTYIRYQDEEDIQYSEYKAIKRRIQFLKEYIIT